MPAEFIYSTYKLARHYPPDRTVLEDISISFYPGAKIGVIGPNGAGKSSLLRVMAGLDDGFTGEARLTPGFTVGYLSQEPQLDPAKDVKGNVMDGVREVAALLDQYNAVMAKWTDPDADYEAVGAEQSRLEDRINAADAWNVERNVEVAMEELRCPPDDADVTTISGGEKRRDLADAVHDVSLDVLGRVELRLLAQVTDREARRETGLAGEPVVEPGHDPEEARLPCPVRSDDADLGARVERDRDVFEHRPVRRVVAGELVGAVDELGWHGHQGYRQEAEPASM
jgi:energy-coupling factor transporter ATP-binding protein EcfA2